jgi:glycosyltransferase involved in cell wall biosynthesis
MDKILTISRYISEKLSSFAPKIAGRTTTIHYGIDLTRFKTGTMKSGFLRKRFGLGMDTPVLGTVGDLWKNQIEFLDALVEVRKIFPDARFALVASESGIGQVRAFKDRVAHLGLDNAVLWASRLSKDEMKLFYADIDVAVSTHRNEGFGIWILEALAMGRPVVAFDEGGIRDSLEGCPAGVLVSGGAKDMAGEIIRILQDNVLRNRMSEAGPQWVAERFNRERMVKDYLNFFKSVS